ncbi:MAG TPA: peptidase M13 [Bacteroidetes bacterium]|nr:peptidase M13 [Bacteroidota bacterium]HCN36316.1 peptidase M13 [Bacteroidota bacterium]
MKNIFAVIFLICFVTNLFSQSSNNIVKVKGVSLDNMDLSVNPAEDFYKFANGNWIKNNPVPPEYSRWGAFSEITKSNESLLISILEEAMISNSPLGTNKQKLGDLYFTAMDTVKIENLKFTPLLPLFEKINSVKNNDDLIKIIGYLHQMGIGNSFGFFASQDARNSSNVIPMFYQGGLTLPDKDYYLSTDKRSEEIRKKYIDHISKMLILTGVDDEIALTDANKIFNFEKMLAEKYMSRVTQRNPDSTYHKMNLSEFKSLSPSVNWDVYFNETGLNENSFSNGTNVGQPRFYAFLNDLFNSNLTEDWKLYLKWKVLNSFAEFLSSEFVNENFNFFSAFLSGIKEQEPRWKKSLGVINRSLGEALGELYVAKAFSPESKSKILNMVDNIKDALRESLNKLDWMEDKTKEQALRKLSTFKVKIGYPDVWRDYSAMNINRNSLVDNIIESRKFNFRRMMNKIGKPVDLYEWGMNPQTVNAYYSATKNEIVFPAGILQPPFFDANADDAVNYGGIGGVIGHEIGHGFDDAGRKFDADGNLNDWWTPEDNKRYNKLADKVVDHYSSIIVIDSSAVNGELTLGENLADIGGMSLAYYALEKSLKNKKPELIDGFTPQQRFFISWATIWRNTITDDGLRLQLKTDSHSPGVVRGVAPLLHFKPFYEAFNIPDNAPIALPVENRVKIW